MRTILRLSSALCAGALAASALAQEYPAQPIRVLVTVPPGGGSDLIARIVTQKMSDALKQSFVVENRPGASGAIAAEAAAKAPADGYTLLSGTSSTVVMLPATNPKYPLDTLRDFAPIGVMVRADNIVVVRADLAAKTLAELLAHAKANPGKVTYGTAGVGTTQHMAAELLSHVAGIQLTHVPYKGTTQAEADLVAGRIDLIFNNVLPPAVASIRQGKTRALAVASDRRSTELPDTPTTAELGYPTIEVYGWVGLFAPAGTPKPIIDRLSAELKRALDDQEVNAKLVKLGNVVGYRDPEATQQYIRAELDKWRGVVRARNLKFD